MSVYLPAGPRVITLQVCLTSPLGATRNPRNEHPNRRRHALQL
jgi:hypothetical protein